MSTAGPTHTPTNDARSVEAGMLLLGAGAILLFISLFLEWYQPGIDAWEIFEVWDLVLAVLAVVVLVAVAGRLGLAPPRPASWLIGPAVAALVIVLFAIVNPPPLTPDIDGDPSTGLWLALASALLMAVGVALSVARISVAINAAGGAGAGPVGAGRFGRGRGVADPVDPAEAGAPVGPGTPGPVTGRTTAPTEPTRRL